jgi:hypothetical protein
MGTYDAYMEGINNMLDKYTELNNERLLGNGR